MSTSSGKLIRVVMVGTGNVAFSLTQSLLQGGCQIVQVVGRSLPSANELSNLARCNFTVSLSDLCLDADLYILAVPDVAIAEVASKVAKLNGIVVHTSGSTPMHVLSPMSNRIGVFYPFQTFTKGLFVNLQGTPICVEACCSEVMQLLMGLAQTLKASPIEMSSENRQMLHVAGVFSSNFVNHMLAISQLLAQEYEFSFSLLKPLVEETVRKALNGNALESQTGPAIRGDSETIKKHVAMLSMLDDDLRDLYMSLSNSIMSLKQYQD